MRHLSQVLTLMGRENLSFGPAVRCVHLAGSMKRNTHILIVALAATFAACSLDDPQTVDDEFDSSDPGSQVITTDDFDFDSYIVAADDFDAYMRAALECTTEDDCEYQPEQTLAQCLAACQAGPRSIEAFCRVIPHPVIRGACWAVVYAGPVACSGFCYWYYTP